MNRLLLTLWTFWSLISLVFSATGPVSGRIERVAPTSFSIRIGKDLVTGDWGPKTRFWAKRAESSATAFKVGDAVWARLKTTVAPVQIRELADVDSWVWLESIRKSIRLGTIIRIDPKYAFVRFGDNTEMPYRVTPKSQIKIKGQPVTLADLKEGQSLYLKGRTLATLDIWLVSATDVAPPAELEKPVTTPKGSSARASSKSKSKKAVVQKPVRPLKLGMIGDLTGEVQLVMSGQGMFDVLASGTRLHISFTSATQFMLGRERVAPGELLPGMRVKISYRRDSYGRINASRVILLRDSSGF